MPPLRAIWTGAISFGLVSAPVRMHSAIQEHTLHFNYVHAPDGSRIGHEKICKAEGRPVPDDEIVKAFEYEGGEWVYMTDEDFEAAAAENHRTMDIRAFVPYEEVDPILFERTYYLGPEEGGEKVYALLARAMSDSGLAAIAKWVMRDRQNLGLLRVRDGVIAVERMYFADEIRKAEGLAPTGAEVSEEELEMAEQLIQQYSGKFEPEQYRDTYRDALCEIIKAKRKGEEVRLEARPEPEPATDLMSALRQSVEAARRRDSRVASEADGDFEDMSKDELYELAKRADIPGRSEMTKKQLVEALKAA